MKKRHLSPWVAGLLALFADGLSSAHALNLHTQAEATHTVYNGSVVLDNGATASWTTSGSTVTLSLNVSGNQVQSILDPDNAAPFWEFAGRSLFSSILITDIGAAILSNQENGREGAGGYLRITTVGSSHMEWGRPEIPEGADEFVYINNSRNGYHLEAYGNAGPPMLSGDHDYYYRRYVATTPQYITNGYTGGMSGQPREGDHTEGIPLPGYPHLQINKVPVLFDSTPTLTIDARAHAAAQLSEAWIYNEETGEGYSNFVQGTSLTQVNVSFTIELVAYDPSVQFTGFLDLTPNPHFPEETQVNMGDSWNWYELRIPGKIDMLQINNVGGSPTPFLPAVLDKDRAFRGFVVNTTREVVMDLADHKLTLGESATPQDLSTVGRESLLVSSGALTLRNGDVETSRLVEVRNNGTADSTLTLEQGARLFVRDSSVDVGASAGARQAQVIIDGEGSLLETQTLYLGRHGHGATTVRNKGTLYVGDYIEMAAFADGDAELTVTGAGSSLEIAPASPEAIVFIGLGGKGAVTIEAGAAAKWNEGNILIGNDVSTSSGSLLVNGANTTSTGGDFVVAKTGQLRVANGASFQTAAQPGKGLIVSAGSASFESASTGSLGVLRVEAEGKVDFEGGAKFTATSSRVTSSGILTVSEAGTELTVDKMESGTAGLGQTLVQSGAKMTTDDIAFGQTAGASDYLLLAGGSFEHTGTQAKFGGSGVSEMIAQIGSSMNWGHAEITVAAGSEFTVLDELTTSEGGNFKINGGRLSVANQSIFSTEDAAGSGVTIRQGGAARFAFGASAAIGVLDIDNGSVTVETGASVTATSLTLNHGTLLVSGGSRLEFGTGTVANGTMTVGSTSEVQVQSLTVLSGGVVDGRGRIVGNVHNQGGVIRPGNSPGILEIDGDYTQDGGTLQLEIGGLAAGVDFDQLVVTGDFNMLGGVIEFAFIDGFAPTVGQTFSFFDVSGSFTNLATFTVSGLENGWEFSTDYDAETGGFSMTSLNDGIAVVPEPSTIMLLGGGLLVGLAMARLRA